MKYFVNLFTWIFLHTGRKHVYIRRELWLCDPKCIVWHKMCNHKDHTWNSFESCPHEQSGKKWNKFSFNFYILKQTQNPKLAGLKQYIVWSEMKDTDKWQCYEHFRPFFCHMYVHLSQNWGSDGHFEVLSTVHFQPTLIQNNFLTLMGSFTVSDLSRLFHYICDTSW